MKPVPSSLVLSLLLLSVSAHAHTALERLKEFRAEHGDPAKYSDAEKRQELVLETSLAQETMGGAPITTAPDANGSCAYAADNLGYAVPGGLAKENFWKDDGHLRLPKTDAVISQESSPGSQHVVTRGGGLLFAHNAGSRTRTDVSLTYQDGFLQRLEIRSGNLLHKYSETLEYGNDPAHGCQLKRVVVESPELKGTKGVSFDSSLCEALQRKSLVSEKMAAACSEFNQQVGDVIDKFSASLPADEAFTLFTTDPDGSTKLRKYSSHDYPMANAAIVSDCLYSWKPPSTPPAQDGGVERGVPADGVERGAPGFASPAP